MTSDISLYDYFYNEILPLAIQYGMSSDEFWHGDMRLLDAYQKGYIRDKSYTSWLNGSYNMIAFQLAYGSMWSKDKSKKIEYPKYSDPFETFKDNHKSEGEKEEEFRDLAKKQNSFIHNILKGR